jgi:hypothetical protein
MIWGRLMIGLLTLLIVSPGLSAQSADDARRSELIEQWRALGTAIHSAEIDFAYVQMYARPEAAVAPARESAIKRPVPPQPTISPERFSELFEYRDFTDPAQQQSFQQEVLAGQAPLGGFWNPGYQLAFQGRTLFNQQSELKLLTNGEHLAEHDERNRQIKLVDHHQSPLRFFHMGDFYLLSPALEAWAQNWEIARSGGELILIAPDSAQDFAGSRLTFDEASGILLRGEYRWRGELQTLKLTKDLLQLPGQVIIPRYAATARFQNDKLTELDMTAIETIRVNQEIPQERFFMPAAAGVTLIDQRGGAARAERLQGPVDNVLTYFDQQPVGPAQSVPLASTAGWRSGLLYVNGFILLLVGVMLWRRGQTSA